ncbi:uncharacterized protein BDV17DRAFT_293950 [Aspergillus undulatus]|uniref:uncharacterized protein n=1 Tax=Aspergillus undulatus TaxID=1810928 RepID=UPI003CCE1089
MSNSRELKGLKSLEELIFFIRDLQVRRSGRSQPVQSSQADTWDGEVGFAAFAQREIDAWKQLGVTRPLDFLIPPAGPPEASVACHLHNPTFHVADPFRRVMDDLSNPSIKQVNDAGLTSEKCLLFDHISRRDETLDCTRFYPDNVRKIHEDFTFKLRRRMKAVVEICRGHHVHKRMQFSGLELIPLCLWRNSRALHCTWKYKPNRIRDGL